ncbi:hypothetical protein K439DRAFT_1361128 [Ramaria rubella]|nr:hypothetical protein K439DRAFT_1361128 [Ramaria rubella]
MNTNIDLEFQRAVGRFLESKDRPFTVSGSILIPDNDPLILFFRTSSGISHSLPFPLKTDILHQLPALNVLLAACETAPGSPFDAALPIAESLETDRELPLVWPSIHPFSTTFELANHPVLDTVRSVLFPNCHPGTYLFAVRDKLEVFLAGAHSDPRRPFSSRGHEGAKLVATIILTLPVRFHGGALAVRNPEGEEERIYPLAHTQGSSGDTVLHWTAVLANCEHEVEFVEQGCRMTISYGVYMKTFGPVGPRPNPLLTPNDKMLDALSSLLNLSRGRRLGVYLTGQYECCPIDVLADSLVPMLKGSDAVLYHALRLYKLTPELRWAAAGYVWPGDKTVQLSAYVDRDDRSIGRQNINYPYNTPNSPGRSHRTARMVMTGVGSYSQGSRSVIFDPEEEDEEEDLRERVAEGGAIPLQDAEIVMLTARDLSISRQKVPFVSRGMQDILYVNLLLLFYVS